MLNSTEIWEIYNETMDAHPIHLHLVSMQLINRQKFFKLDALYIGKESKKIECESKDAAVPAVFYILSAPAHAKHPTTLIKSTDAESNALGSLETSNQRTIY